VCLAVTSSFPRSFSIPLSEEIKHYYSHLAEDKHAEHNRDFQKAINADVVDFCREEGALKVTTRDASSRRMAGLLKEMLFRDLAWHINLQKKAKEAAALKRNQETSAAAAAKVLEQTKLQSSSSHLYSEEFSVQKDMMGFAIGANGSNVQRARKIKGVVSVEQLGRSSCKFKVTGHSKEAVQKVRLMLDLSKTIVQASRTGVLSSSGECCCCRCRDAR
jgi:hypothetical protein